MSLNAEQLKAVRSEARNTLVIAAPGSGKTAVIAARIVENMRRGIDPKRIAAITYTNAAAREIQARVDDQINVAQDLMRASPFPTIQNVDLEKKNEIQLGYIGTIHGYALKILQQYGAKVGLPPKIGVLNEAQADELLERTASDLHFKGPKKAIAAAVLERVLDLSGVPAAQKMHVEYATTNANLVAFDYFHRQQATGALSFDAIIAFASVVVSEVLGIEELLVDEYQDCTPLTHALCMAHPGRKFFVGDPDQAIFSFAGGSVNNIMAISTHEDWAVMQLRINYRSTPNICAVAQRLIEHNRTRVKKVLTPAPNNFLLDACATLTYQANDPLAEYAWIAEGLRLANDQGRTAAVLFRTNALAEEAAAYFQGLSLKIRSKAFAPVPSDWATARQFVALAANPENDLLAYWFLRDTRGLKFADKARLEAAEAGLTINIKLLKMPPDIAPDQIPGILEKIRVAPQSIALVETAIATLPPGAGAQDLCLALGNVDVRGSEIGQGAVVATIHSAKGREWDWVFIGGCEDEIIPGRSAAGAPLEEERRLFFVAMSRARERLCYSYSKVRRAPWQRVPAGATPSRFLGEIGL